MTVYNSVILLETGVPLANTTPRPPVTSSRYRHFINISLLRWASDVDNPATFRIFVYKNRFLYAWLSSTNSRSTPSCSKVITSSFRSVFSSLSNLAWRDFRVFSICLMVNSRPGFVSTRPALRLHHQSVPVRAAPAAPLRWEFSRTGYGR